MRKKDFVNMATKKREKEDEDSTGFGAKLFLAAVFVTLFFIVLFSMLAATFP